MLNYENDKTEFISALTDKSIKEIVAFANSSGGTIYYGVEDSGRVIGIDNIDAEYSRLTNIIRDSISPDITLFLSAEISEQNGMKYIRVDYS